MERRLCGKDQLDTNFADLVLICVPIAFLRFGIYLRVATCLRGTTLSTKGIAAERILPR